MPTPRLWHFDPFAPDSPPALSWPAWLAFAVLVMAVGLVEIVARTVHGAWLAARTRTSVALIEAGMRVGPPPPMREHVRRDPVWMVVTCPKGSAAVMSSIEPGPVVGAPGQLERWRDAGEGERGQTFEDACAEMARRNGKQSTASMGPRDAAEGGE